MTRQVIKLPCCPCHPNWVVGTLAHLVSYGALELGNQEHFPDGIEPFVRY